MREEAARVCAQGIEEASDAGIQNRRWWEKAIDWVTDNWDTLVDACKLVVAVLGIVVMIIGGPLAWVVLAAAIVVLADTLIKYARGEAGLLDVAFAALDCIPGMKGLTTLGGLARGLRSAASTGLAGLRMGVRGLGRAARRTGRQGDALFCRTDPIDMATGDMVLDAVDVQLPGVLPLVLRRHHRSTLRDGLWFGPSWTSTLDQRLVLSPQGVRLITDDGMVLHYPRPIVDEPVLPVEGPRWELSWDGHPGGAMEVRRPESGLVTRFAPAPGQPGGVLPVAAVRDPNGNEITFLHDESGAPKEVRHHGGYRLGLTVVDRRVTAIRLLSHPERPVLTRYAYSAHGDLSAVVNSSGLPLLLHYDEQHRITGWVDRNEFRYRYHYDEQGRCVITDGSEGALSSRVDYDADTYRTVFTDSLGHTTVYQFNDSYQLTTETDALGHHTHRSWDRYDRLESVTDQLGRVTRYEHDERGRRTAVITPDGGRTEIIPWEFGRWAGVTDPDGAHWSREYDERGNLTRIVDPAGGVETFQYDERGATVRHTSPAGVTHEFRNDAAGLPTAVTGDGSMDVRLRRDAFGRVVAVEEVGGGSVRSTWSIEGALLSRTLADGRTERWTYDGEGNLVESVDAAGGRTRHSIGVFDQTVETELPSGARWRRVYDTELRLRTVINPAGLTWTYEYDAVGRLVGETDFSGRRVTYEYDAAGQRIGQTNGAGETIRRAFNARGDMVTQTIGDQTAHFTYTAAGLMTGAANETVALRFTHDPLGRVIEESSDDHRTLFGYDADGRRVYRRTPAGVESRWEWAGADMPEAVHVAGRTITFAQGSGDSRDREVVRHLPGGARVEQSWDVLAQLSEQLVTARGDRRLLHRTYEYGPEGHLRSIQEVTPHGDNTRRLVTDAAGRVTALRGGTQPEERYAYDASGNMTVVVAPQLPNTVDEGPHDAPDSPQSDVMDGIRVTRVGRTHYDYDGQGRVVRRRQRRLSGQTREWRYRWNAADQLTEVWTPDGSHWRYSYDALGRRVVKQHIDRSGRILREIRFVWDETRVAEQSVDEGSERRTTTWEWEPESHRAIAQTERRFLRHARQEEIDERFYSIIADLVGTPTELVDEAGDIAWRRRTTLWGWAPDTTSEPGGAEDASPRCPLRFPGQYHDDETHLHYNLFRYYDPEAGWYWSPDALGLHVSDHPYRYVDHPQLASDPLGLAPCLAEQLAGRASEFAGSQSARTQSHQTVAVVRVRTPHGELDLVAGSGSGLRRPQPSMVDPSRVPPEWAVPNIAGTHAEQNALLYANSQGWTPIAGGASRQVCPDICAPLIRAGGGRVTGNVMPNEQRPRTFEW
ncbi:DUF6531 domain-containing protein [Streptomyces triticirhizae]|uniref:RHS repeat protein n=1 Tax=Streptomyces triticirhizae TaxID=2483353 RepID=A0A3M2L630_9ACTN|nr:DUF6531 domain-containing protein [Streptomyces triticirhizae]RMI32003.1 hypothetical protein EBN88_25490 [Streptomyces triticirhizae]